MIQMKNVSRDGLSGGQRIHIVSRINLSLPSEGIVLVTGRPGCGKTMLLRLIAGVEVPTRGEILIRGERTSAWNEAQAAAWRRSASLASAEYLMPDRTLKDGLLFRAALSGLGRAEAAARATDVMARLGLAAHADALPDELGGEERKLAALACAWISDPDVLLVDEPLEGVGEGMAPQVLALLRETAENCLVIAASSNGELFFGEDIRIVEMDGGELVSEEEETASEDSRRAKPRGASVSAPGFAMRSLFRRGRGTIIRTLVPLFVVLALCLTFAVLHGEAAYERALQTETLTDYPITIRAENVPSGDLEKLADWLESKTDGKGVAVQRSFAISPRIFSVTAAEGVRQVNPAPGTDVSLWTELPEGEERRGYLYDLVSGRWPENYSEAVVVLNAQSVMDTACINALGLSADNLGRGITYPELIRMSFRVILPVDEYVRNVDGTWGFMGGDPSYMRTIAETSLTLNIVGVVVPKENAAGGTAAGGAAYTAELTRWAVDRVLQSDLVREQLASPDRDAVTGLPFDDRGVHTADTSVQRSLLERYAVSLSVAEQTALYLKITGTPVEETAAQDSLLKLMEEMDADSLYRLYSEIILSGAAQSTLEDNLRSFGATDAETITAIRVYAASYAYRESAVSILRSYAEQVSYDDSADGIISTGTRLMESGRMLYPILYAIAGLLACAAIVPAFLLPILSRRREVSLCRCCGLSSATAASSLGWESFILSLIGSAAGSVIALALVRTGALDLLLSRNWELSWQGAFIPGTAAVLLSWIVGRIAAAAVTAGSPGDGLRKAAI